MKRSFHSAWARELQAFLDFKRSLGYQYRRAEFTLRAVDRFLLDHADAQRDQDLHQAILTWLEQRPGRKPISVACELAVVRQFYRFLRRRGEGQLCEPPWPRLPAISHYVPHILSKKDILQLLDLTTRLRGQFRRIMYRTLILLLYCTGLRFGEALRLRLRDVDLKDATFFISAFKGRSRWVPYHRSLTPELKRYLEARSAFAPAGPDDRLFVGVNKIRLPNGTASDTVRMLLRTAGLKPESGRMGPRPYDLRHAFAVQRLTLWYRAGVDLHARLPWLSAYMGHDDLLGTEYYLTATPELLALAGNRFRRHFMKKGKTVDEPT